MKISLAITTFQRFELTIKSFEKVINDERISEVIILDDFSQDNSFEKLIKYFENVPHVRVYQQQFNKGMSFNKRDAISLCYNDWVIILDSDNQIGLDYLDNIPKYVEDQFIYMPDFARPNFDYRKFNKMFIHKLNAKEFVSDPIGNMCANTCNYLVNKKKYLEIYEEDKSVMETDTIHFFYLWVKAGYAFQVVEGMQYDHLVHPQSAWLMNAKYNLQKGEETRIKIMEL
ncbi:MAG: glycosyltransferase [Ferruginibacter sp.]